MRDRRGEREKWENSRLGKSTVVDEIVEALSIFFSVRFFCGRDGGTRWHDESFLSSQNCIVVLRYREIEIKVSFMRAFALAHRTTTIFVQRQLVGKILFFFFFFFGIVIFKICNYSEENTKIRKEREGYLKDIRKIRISLDSLSVSAVSFGYLRCLRSVSFTSSKSAMIIVLRHAIKKKRIRKRDVWLCSSRSKNSEESFSPSVRSRLCTSCRPSLRRGRYAKQSGEWRIGRIYGEKQKNL